MKLNSYFAALLVVCFLSGVASAQNVVEDEGVTISQQEMEQLVKHWTPEMQSAAADNLGDRLELINFALTNKKVAAQVRMITPESDPDTYWRHQFELQNMNRQLVVQEFLAQLEVPDMTGLAPERYHSEKQKYAFVPETRHASHILLLCPGLKCIRSDRRLEADSIVAKLKAGESFETLVEAHSEDPGTRNSGGVFKQEMALGMKEVDAHFVGGVFGIEKVGDYSDVVESKFGFHVIRLDQVQEEYYRTFDEVRDEIITDLDSGFRQLSAKDFDAQFRVTDDAVINGPAMDAIFEKYKSQALPK